MDSPAPFSLSHKNAERCYASVICDNNCDSSPLCVDFELRAMLCFHDSQQRQLFRRTVVYHLCLWKAKACKGDFKIFADMICLAQKRTLSICKTEKPLSS